jgi:hypothetical protein
VASEQERRDDYERSLRRREQFEAMLERMLRGSNTAKAALDERWEARTRSDNE